MKTFKQHFNEASANPIKGWDNLLKKNEELATGVRLAKKIEKLGGEAVIAGGAVRDIVSGRPIKDVDIATNVPMELIKQHFKWDNIGTSQQFGIIMVHFGGYEFEVANYRSDEY